MSTTSEQKLENKVDTADAMKDSAQSVLAMKQEPLDSLVSNQNGTNGGEGAPLNVPKPVKTEGEASAIENSFLPRSLPLQPSQPNPSTPSPVTPFAPNIGNLSAHLTMDEHTAIYKKANILALSGLAKKGGPNTKDMFAVQQKLQEFLTSLITLAGQKGPQLKVNVQMLVQNLVTGQISEEEFATKIESDLRSQHQPSLLPFLKSSVPHLKTRLQLQQAIMKELIQRTVVEKNIPTATSPASSTSSLGTGTTTITTSTTTAGSSSTDSLSSSSTASSSSSLLVGVSAAQGNMPPTTSLVKVTRGGSGLSQNTAKPVTIGGSVVSVGNQATPTTALGVAGNSSSLDNVSLHLPKGMSEQISKLPPEQKLLYIQQFLKSQHLKQQQQQLKTVREKQMKLVQEQQVPLVMGVTRPALAIGIARSTTMNMAKPASAGMVNTASAGVMRTVASAGVGTSKATSGTDVRGKVGLMSIKAGSSGTSVSTYAASSPSSAVAVSGGGKKKGKGKETAMDAE